jgi:hypothetical protein
MLIVFWGFEFPVASVGTPPVDGVCAIIPIGNALMKNSHRNFQFGRFVLQGGGYEKVIESNVGFTTM